LIRERRTARAIALWLGLALSLASSAHGAGPVDITELARETQRVFQDGQTLQLVWWIPAELWAEWAAAAGLSGARAEMAVGPLRTHTVLFVAEGAISAAGTTAFKGPDALAGRIRVRDAGGRSHTPLAANEIPPDINVMITGLQPQLGRALGPAGEHLHAFVFAPEDGAPLASGRSEGIFTVQIDERAFAYRLPLSALVPPRRCPVDGERLSGTFQYCPYHGNPLEAEPAPATPPAPPR
jgi:hypothetical protein